MKKIILLLAASTISVAAMAQQQGEFSLTGNLLISGGNSSSQITTNGNTVNSKAASPLTFDFGVGAGYFIMDNVEVSLGLYYGLFKEKNLYSTQDNDFYDSSNSFTIKPEVSYYIPLGSDMFFWKPGLELGFTFNSKKQEVNKDTTNKLKQPFGFTLGVDILGFEFRPWEHLGFDFSIGGLYYNVESLTTSTEGMTTKLANHDISFGFDNYFSPTLGIKYIF